MTILNSELTKAHAIVREAMAKLREKLDKRGLVDAVVFMSPSTTGLILVSNLPAKLAPITYRTFYTLSEASDFLDSLPADCWAAAKPVKMVGIPQR